MATILTLTENDYRLKNSRNFIENFSNNMYNLYAFSGYVVPFSQVNNSVTSNIQTPTPDNKTSFTDVWRNMAFGKKIQNTDVNLIINYYPWAANTIFSQYDDTDINLLNEQFYTHVNDSSYVHCFKCLFNAQNSYSVISPSISDVNGSDNIFTLADGYTWKYMYSVDSSTVSKFGTQTMIPIVANAAVSNAAVAGSIDVINIDQPGLGYNNYTNGTFSVSDTRLNGNSLVYSINGAYSPSGVNTFYNGCLLYITSGIGAGQYSNIINYQVNNTFHYVVLENEFSTVPQNSSEFIIAPGIMIIGDGTETQQAVAMAQINSTAGNTIAGITMLQYGAGYKYTNTFINVSNVVPVIQNSVVRAIQSPPGGHGFDAASELGCNTVCISTMFSNTENNTIPSNGSYRQLGLLENPIFTGCTLGVSNQVGEFIIGEQIYVYSYIKIADNVSVNSFTNVVSSSDGDFLKQLKSNSQVIIIASGQTQLANVSTITNSTNFSISTNAFFNSTNAIIGIAVLGSSGYGSGFSLGQVNLANVSGDIVLGENIIGYASGATAYVANCKISNVTKDFDTFVQMNAYDGYQITGTFQQGENIFQTSNSLYGYYDSLVVISNTVSRYYISNQIGIFDAGLNINGVNSGATAYVSATYDPEVVFGSGDILYIQNFDQIQRGINYTEQFKIFLNF